MVRLSLSPTNQVFHHYHLLFLLLFLAPPAVLRAAQPQETNYDESKVPPYTLPEALECFDGQRVVDAKLWREKRRPEILRAFIENVYGRTPQLTVVPRYEVTESDAHALGGLATRKQVTIRLFPEDDAPQIDLLLFVPNAATKPVPAFLSLNYGNQGVCNDPAIKPSRDTKTRRGENASRWPLEMILKRGYAVATFAGADVEQDARGSGTDRRPGAWRLGVRGYALRKAGRDDRAADDWGTIGAWAWGLSRVLDYLETVPAIDAKKVVVIGHSRTGKTALWAAAQDERFAIAISNDSGAGGAALAKRLFGEAVLHSPEIWFCRNYRRFARNEKSLPVDQHELLALIAPRPVYVASATQDPWSDPRGEFLSALHAEPVYRLFGSGGLGVTEMPAPETPVGETIGYHLRTGVHEITAYDWQQYLNFADRHFQCRTGSANRPITASNRRSQKTHGSRAGRAEAAAIELACRLTTWTHRAIGGYYGGISGAAVSVARRKISVATAGADQRLLAKPARKGRQRSLELIVTV